MRSKIIGEIVAEHRARICDDRIFFAPEIPADKRRNAVAQYAKSAQSEVALALVDNSFFGSAKDGVLITDQRIYSNEWLETASSLRLDEIETVEFVEENYSKNIYINRIRFANLHMPEQNAVRKLVEMLDEIRRLFHCDHHADQSPNRQPAARTGKCQSCGASFVARHRLARCDYCSSHL